MKTLFFSLFTLIVCHQLGCSSIQVADPNSAEGMFKIAEQLEKDERFEEAITKFNELRNKHPYSRYATEAELRVADIHFKKEAFIESATAYQLFKDFHPKHPRNDYVTYKIALSYFNQLPSTIDRDLTPAFKAISAFKEVESSYSTSEYFKEAQTKKNECIKMLAEKELYIANFYFIRDIYDSALRRFESLITKFPNRSFDEEALYKAGISAFETGQKERGEKHIRELLKTFPNGSYASSGKNALEKYGSR